jgi:ABC-type dipeptide/oligopeptide/nickel transport system permease subunit
LTTQPQTVAEGRRVEALDVRHSALRTPHSALRLAKRKPLGVFAALLLLAVVVMAVFAPLVATHKPAKTDPFAIAQGPLERGHVLGTDDLGRDIWSRIVYGARYSLQVALLATAIGVVAGSFVGLTSAWFAGWYDLIVQRLIDVMQAFPGILLALALVSVLRPSTTNLVIAIAVGITPGTARVVCGAALSVKQNVYIEAARTIGAGTPRMIARYLLPNVMAPITVLIALDLGRAILTEASLTFLGVAPLNNPSWGGMLSGSGRQYLIIAPHMAIVPGLAITLTVLALNLMGDTLRDVLDPRLRGT